MPPLVPQRNGSALIECLCCGVWNTAAQCVTAVMRACEAAARCLCVADSGLRKPHGSVFARRADAVTGHVLGYCMSKVVCVVTCTLSK